MNKLIFRFIISLILLLALSITYLSTLGFETDRFNNQISNQIKKIDENIELELKKVKILLDPIKLKINAKTIGSNVKYSDKEIQIETIKFSLSLRSLISKKPLLTDLNISTKSIEIKNLISFVRLFKNNAKLFIAEKIIKKGFLIANIKIDFDQTGKIKNNYEITGFVKDVKINLFDKYQLSKINLNFGLNQNEFNSEKIDLLLNENKIFLPLLRIKKINEKFLVSGKINSTNFVLQDKDLKNILSLIQIEQNIKKIEFSSVNNFEFEIDKKSKIKKLKTSSKIDLNELILKNKTDFVKYFPRLKDEIKFQKNKIELEYNNETLKLKGFGKILIQNTNDNIEYNLTKNKTNLIFETNLNISNNVLTLDLLNFQKEKDSVLTIRVKGNKKIDNNIFFEKIHLNEKNNNFIISHLYLDNQNMIKGFKEINLNYLDRNKLKNEVSITKKKGDYILEGKILNLTKFIDNILKYKKDNNKSFFKDSLNLKVDVKKIYLDKYSRFTDLKGYLTIKDSKILDAELVSFFSNDKKFTFTVKSKDNQKTTTFFSEYPKPLVNRYKFIKGFDEGTLDFFSVEKNDISKSVLVIDNFKLKEVPILAKILTLASLQGIADLLTGEGIRFTDFEMKFTNTKGLMTIDEMYAIGPAISILLEGYIENQNLISLRGTLVPATTINRSIASIPLIGDILVGKKVGEGVFGVSFKIKGPPKKLETTVNPIKTLTPRFITRTIEKIKKN